MTFCSTRTCRVEEKISLNVSRLEVNPAGMIDLDTGHVTRWNLDYLGDIRRLAWTGDGQITGVTAIEKSTLWKFQPQTIKK